MPRIAARWRSSLGRASRFTAALRLLALTALISLAAGDTRSHADDQPRLLVLSLLEQSSPVPREEAEPDAFPAPLEPLLAIDHRLLDVEAHRAALEICDADSGAYSHHDLLGYDKPHPGLLLTELRSLDSSWFRPRDFRRPAGLADLQWRPDRPRQEVGAARFALSGLDANEQRSVIGGGLKWLTADTRSQRVHLEARTLWLCEFLQSTYTTTAFYSPNDDGLYVMQGFSRGANWLMLGGGMRWQLAGGWNAYATYDAQVNSLEMFHIGSTGLRYSW